MHKTFTQYMTMTLMGDDDDDILAGRALRFVRHSYCNGCCAIVYMLPATCLTQVWLQLHIHIYVAGMERANAALILAKG